MQCLFGNYVITTWRRNWGATQSVKWGMIGPSASLPLSCDVIPGKVYYKYAGGGGCASHKHQGPNGVSSALPWSNHISPFEVALWRLYTGLLAWLQKNVIQDGRKYEYVCSWSRLLTSIFTPITALIQYFSDYSHIRQITWLWINSASLEPKIKRANSSDVYMSLPCPDIFPRNTLMKDILPTNILPKGQFADGHFAKWALWPMDNLTNVFFTQDILPNMAKNREMFGTMIRFVDVLGTVARILFLEHCVKQQLYGHYSSA